MATVNLGRIKPQWQGNYASETSYVIDDMVLYNNSAYICTAASQGNAPTDTNYWDLMTQGFSGDAADITSGTIPDARFPATLPAISGANLTNVSAGKLLQVVRGNDVETANTQFAGNSWSEVNTGLRTSITLESDNPILQVLWIMNGEADGTVEDRVSAQIFASINGGSYTKWSQTQYAGNFSPTYGQEGFQSMMVYTPITANAGDVITLTPYAACEAGTDLLIQFGQNVFGGADFECRMIISEIAS